jgi:hypothetical protein
MMSLAKVERASINYILQYSNLFVNNDEAIQKPGYDSRACKRSEE